ncbi:MAG: patatin-like phospholipase family protein [Chlorobiales bacterium]|nr:patatin-like phospholipase family protein [Chlorobiales bacterium]
MKRKVRPKFEQGLTLALGGGGARGFAHVGVLEVLHKHDVPVTTIVGTSAGAVAGAGYALGNHPRTMRKRVMEFAESPLANHPKLRALVAQEQEISWRSLGDRLARFLSQGQLVKSLLMEASVMGEGYFKDVVDFFLPKARIEYMSIRFIAAATDMLSGKPVALAQGDLRTAVLASSSVPGIAPPVVLGERYLADGGVACLVPVELALEHEGARVLAVGVDRSIEAGAPPNQALDAYLRAGDIMLARMGDIMLAQAHLALRPAVGHIHWLDFTRAEEIMDLGAEVAEEAIPRIQELCRRPTWRDRMRCWLNGGPDLGAV